MLALRALTAFLSLNRIGFGLAYLLNPAGAGEGWLGKIARVPMVQVSIRGLGARDLALGAGALAALVRGDNQAARVWLAGQTVADASDLVSTVRAKKFLPKSGFKLAVAMAGGSALIAAAGAVGLRRGSRGGDEPLAKPPQLA
jgi:hypothetical protein